MNGQNCIAEGARSKRSTSNPLLCLPSDSRLRALVQPCIRDYLFDRTRLSQQNLDALRDILDPCPSSRSQAVFDSGRFKPESAVSDCFIRTRPKRLNGVSVQQQCCYNSVG